MFFTGIIEPEKLSWTVWASVIGPEQRDRIEGAGPDLDLFQVAEILKQSFDGWFCGAHLKPPVAAHVHGCGRPIVGYGDFTDADRDRPLFLPDHLDGRLYCRGRSVGE